MRAKTLSRQSRKQSIAETAERLPNLGPGEIVSLTGEREAVSTATHSLCVERLSDGGRVLWVDGGNTLDPLLLLRLLRSGRQSSRWALDDITLARAFTVHQMSSILEGRLWPRVSEDGPSLVIVSSLDELFADPDVDRMEARELLGRALDTLREMATMEDVAVLVAGGVFKGMRSVRVSDGPRGIRFHEGRVD